MTPLRARAAQRSLAVGCDSVGVSCEARPCYDTLLRAIARHICGNSKSSSNGGGAAEGVHRSSNRTPKNIYGRLKRSFRPEAPDWNGPVYVSVILERNPVCFHDPDPWDADYEDWQRRWNCWKYKKVEGGWLNGDKQVADDTSDEANFRPEPVSTEADRENDIRSLRRCTQGFLYLALRNHDQGSWQLPSTLVQGDEQIHKAAQRALSEAVGTSIETFIFGNAPAGHVEAEEARTFLMQGAVLDGNIVLPDSSSAVDFAWLTRGELLKEYESNHALTVVLRAWFCE